MGDIRITGNNQTSYAPHVGTQSIPTKTGPSSGAPSQPPEDGGPLLGTDSTADVPPNGSVPDPGNPSSGGTAGGTGIDPSNPFANGNTYDPYAVAATYGNDPNSGPPPYKPGPPASGDPMIRCAWLDQQLKTQQQYQDQLAALQQGMQDGSLDPAKAQELIAKLQKLMWSQTDIDNAQAESDDLHSKNLGPEDDLDGDGIANKDDPDIDGDGLTNQAEAQNHTNAYDVDTDHDGITDYGELWLKQHVNGYQNMDPNNPDSNHDGIIDGQELPASVTVANGGKPILTSQLGQSGNGTSTGGTTGTSSTGGTGTPGGPGTTGPGGVGTQSTSYLWNPPASNAQTINATDGDKTVNAQQNGQPVDTVINGDGGPLDFNKDGNDLVVKTDKGTVRITGYYDNNGKPTSKIYLQGSTSGITTNNNVNIGAVDTNGDNFADAGINQDGLTNSGSVTNNYDPFGGNGPKIDSSASTNDTTVYDVSSGDNGQFTVPDQINGQQVKDVEVTVDGNDVIITCKDAINGNTLKTFKLKDGKSLVDNGSIHFQLADTGQRFYSNDHSMAVTVNGGKGDDEILIYNGTVNGGDGNDFIQANGNGKIDGGTGDNTLVGSDGSTLTAEGDGDNFMYLSGHTGTAHGSDGDDVIIVADPSTQAAYHLDGGGGTNMTNTANTSEGSLDHHFQVTGNDPGGILSFITAHEKDANSDLLSELQKLYDPNNPDHSVLGSAAESVASTVAQAAASFLVQKKNEFDSKYGGTHQAGFDPTGGGTTPPGGSTPPPGGSTTPPGGSTTPPVTGQSLNFGAPGLMTESLSTTESRRRRNSGDEDITDNGDIPSPMFD